MVFGRISRKEIFKYYGRNSVSENPIFQTGRGSKADTLEKAGILAGYTRADLADLQREDNLKNQKKLRKAIREYKRYILSETFLAVGIVLLGIVCVCNFSFFILLINVLWGAVFTGGILSFILPQLQKSLISVRSAGYLWQKQSND